MVREGVRVLRGESLPEAIMDDETAHKKRSGPNKEKYDDPETDDPHYKDL